MGLMKRFIKRLCCCVCGGEEEISNEQKHFEEGTNSANANIELFVDLADNERTNRTNDIGQRLQEAGFINNSLLTIGTCFEMLRENQRDGTSKVVPYRQSRLTHLFMNYFDREGQVKMIVWVNPTVDDYHETMQVSKFAEMSQEIQVARPVPMKYDLGLTPGRRRRNMNSRDVNGNEGVESSPELTIVHSLGPFPTLVLANPNDADLIKNLVRFFKMRIEKRNLLQKELFAKQKNFRSRLAEIEKQNILAKQEAASAGATIELERRKTAALEDKVVNMESVQFDLEWRIQEKEDQISALRSELDSVTACLSQKIIKDDKEAQ